MKTLQIRISEYDLEIVYATAISGRVIAYCNTHTKEIIMANYIRQVLKHDQRNKLIGRLRSRIEGDFRYIQ